METKQEYTENYKDFTINIFQDNDPTDQFDDNDDLFIVFDHRQFTRCVDGFDPQEIFDEVYSKGKSFYNGYHIFPLSAYIHSGVSLSLGKISGWDSSFKGFVCVKQVKGWSYTKKKAEVIAESLVKTWNDYLSGEVYYYQTIDQFGNEVDSCYGFIGNYKESGIITDCKANIDGIINRNKNKYATQLELQF